MESSNIVFEGPGIVRVIKQKIRPILENEVLCESLKSLVSVGTECRCLRGIFDDGTNWSRWVKYPFSPGYSLSSRVIKIGSKVRSLNVGDIVFSKAPHHQYTIARENEIYKIPEGINDEEATWLSIARTSQNGVRRAQIQMGDYVVFIGIGIVGMLALQFAKNCGATRIITIDTVQSRLEHSKKLGATHTFCGYSNNAMEIVSTLTDNNMADAVFDVTGNPAVLSSACMLVRPYGKIILLGDTTEPSKQFLGPGVVSKSISIQGVHSSMVANEPNMFYPWTGNKTDNITIDFILQKKIDVNTLITDRVSPLDAVSIYRKLLEDNTFAEGILFDWSLL